VITVRRLISKLAVITSLIVATALPVSAQTGSGIVRGHVIGPDGKPLSKQAVVLHRVAGASGLTVATGTSEKDGSFRLTVADAASAADDAVYFLAARYKEELYLGDAFKAPFDTTMDHTVQVGVAATSARALLGATTGGDAQGALPQATAPADPTRWLIFIMPALAIIALVVMLFGPRGRIPPRRRVLLEIAKLDEAEGGSGNAAYRDRRAALIAQLNTPAEV
jgi:hypothetical protein